MTVIEGEKQGPDGRTIVDESIFEEPGAETTTPETTPAETVTPAAETTPKETVTPEKPESGEVTEDQPNGGVVTPKPKEETTTPVVPETLIAGKFKTEDELKKAYQNLGGDPTKFKTTAALVEAYDYRNSEYTRVQQEQAERDRIARIIPNTPHKETVTPAVPLTADDMMAKVDWSKVSDAQTLGKQLFSIMLEAMPKAQAADPTQQMTPEQLVEKIAPIIKEREQKMEALNEIEVEVPRLKKDQAFRKAYAYHVVGGKADGTAYPRTKEGLKEAMKDFLSWGASIAAESARQTTITTAGKKAALPAPEAGGEVLGGGQKDEADEIIGAYAEKQKKFTTER